jgi:hypothetical protein
VHKVNASHFYRTIFHFITHGNNKNEQNSDDLCLQILYRFYIDSKSELSAACVLDSDHFVKNFVCLTKFSHLPTLSHHSSFARHSQKV